MLVEFGKEKAAALKEQEETLAARHADDKTAALAAAERADDKTAAPEAQARTRRRQIRRARGTGDRTRRRQIRRARGTGDRSCRRRRGG